MTAVAEKTLANPPATVTALPAVQRFAPMTDVFADPDTFEHAQRVAKVFASSTLVPPHMRNNVADCLIAYQIARRLNEEPLTVFQNIYVVSGRPGWKTEYVIARANRAGVFSGRITWQATGSGDKLAVTARATLADSGEAIDVTCDMAMAKAEGWTKNAKYTSMPEHMLRWRSAAMLIRLYAPEVMLGMPVVEELETLPAMRDVTPARNLNEALDKLAQLPAGDAWELDDPDTGELELASPQSDQPPVAAGQPAPEQPEGSPPSDSGAGTAHIEGKAEPTESAVEDRDPETAAQYETYAENWIAKLTEVEAATVRWKAEKSMRNKLNVTPDVRDALEAKARAKVAELRKAEGAA